MAYQVRQRDPLLDSNVQISLARRGREGLGVLLVLAGLAVIAMTFSYHADDPSWLSATTAAPRNWLGATGATLAGPMVMVIGKALYALALAMIVWGVRYAVHWHSERALPRALFVALWLPVVAIWAATLVPGPDWGHAFGLGGLFGDTALAVVIEVLPIGSGLGLKLLSVLLTVLAAATGAWVLGFDRDDMRAGLVFFLGGLGGAFWLTRLGLGAAAGGVRTGAVKGAGALIERRAAKAAARAAAAPEARPPHEALPVEATPEMAVADEEGSDAGAARGGLLAFLRREGPAPARDAEPALTAGAAETDDDDRVRARIASAVRTRVRRATIADALSRAPGPTGAPHDGRTEPPLTAAAAPVDAATDAATDDLIEPDYFEAAPGAQAAPEAVPAATPAEPARNRVVVPPRKVQAPAKPAAPSKRAVAEAQPTLAFEDRAAAYETPPLSLLTDPATVERHHLSDEALEENARLLETVLDDYGVKGEIVSVRPGPVVTMYELEPAPGLKASRVIGLADDIARSMAALSARVSTVPGRSVIGIELPNERREKVVLREMLASADYGDSKMALPLALGKDIGGAPVVANLAKMPHLLIAGTTGSGKSVAINTMILSLLYRLSPEECRMIMIDPKMLELSVYDGIPHLLSPVVTDPKKAVVALKWVVGEMEERYRKMSRMGVRNIEGYNGRVQDALDKGELFSRTVQTGFDEETGDPVFETEEHEPVKLPYIVVVVDEMADLMMVAGKEIEACIQRLAQMARASGIHLVMATQRPSVDVITGTVKANFPTRISFHVTSKIDSRTILGEMGAEQLLGMGDMLYMAGGSKITRVHGPFCSDEEVEEIVNHLKSFGPPVYASSVLEGPDDEKSSDIDAVLGLNTGGNTGGEDALYDQAVAIVAKDRKCSTSYIQRKLGIGYNKAARLVEQMEDEGVVSAANHVGKREILVPET